MDKHDKIRYIGLDIFRIVSAAAICAFHSAANQNLNCNYGLLQPFATMGAIFMTAFFMLSGFSLYLNYQQVDLIRLENASAFYLKRFISIMPIYYIVSILYILFKGEETFLQNIVLLPVELLGIQTTFSTLFTISHNGGTWFISCILLCYLLYPFIQQMIKQLKPKAKVIVAGLAVFVLLYAPIVVRLFEIQWIYDSPFYRIMEFLVGVILCSMRDDIMSCRILSKIIFHPVSILGEAAVLIIGVTAAVKLNIAIGNFNLYSWIGLPIFAVMLLGCSNLGGGKSYPKTIKYLSAISYTFFLAQFFSNDIAFMITEALNIENNFLKILLAFSICFILAVLLHEVFEKPLSRRLRKKFCNYMLPEAERRAK